SGGYALPERGDDRGQPGGGQAGQCGGGQQPGEQLRHEQRVRVAGGGVGVQVRGDDGGGGEGGLGGQEPDHGVGAPVGEHGSDGAGDVGDVDRKCSGNALPQQHGNGEDGDGRGEVVADPGPA